jgi:glycosyltransferase involved in cell wall biosynthesis
MMTNTFRPHVGGVARSVEAFAGEFRNRGHEVLVVAPEFPDTPEGEEWVVRVPAVQRFNGSDFSFPVPAPGQLRDRLDDFRPQVVHSHHPFLLGDTALRVAAERSLPIVFTHHTMYELYTHYVPGDSARMKRGAIELAVGYCNLCDAVIAPSESIAEILRERGVTTQIEAIPTGIDLELYGGGDGPAFRRRVRLPEAAFVVGHLGRLAPEKNVPLVAEAMARFLERAPAARALVVGEGPSLDGLVETFEERGLGDRLHLVGRLEARDVADAYAAMDAFLFASTTETQGMVVAEAMAAGVPVVAVDAPGVREVVVDRENGRLLPAQDADALAGALAWVAESERGSRLMRGAADTVCELSLARTAERVLDLYSSLRAARLAEESVEDSLWQKARARLAEEWKIARNVAHALGETLRPEGQ